MELLHITKLSTSTFLRDFLQGAEPARQMFHNQRVTAELCAKRAQHGASRTRLQTLFVNGLRGTTISDLQQHNIDSIVNPGAVVVCGGQQLGMYGGPLYTLLKMRSIVAEAKSISTEFNVPVVPVFWLEDVDHDAAEASEVWLTQPDGSVKKNATWNGSDVKLPSFKRRFSADEVSSIKELASTIQGRFSHDVLQTITSAYAEGKPWADSFLEIIQPFMQAWGVVVVRASDVLLYGLHAPICIRDMEQTGQLASAIEQASLQIEQAGYSRQATVQPFQFFVETENGRSRIDTADAGLTLEGRPYTLKQLIKLSRFHPEKFSPGVLARPLVQDAILPTVASVLGAAEIAYHAQLFYAYSWLGIEQPVPMLRHSACIVDQKTQRQLDKLQHDAPWFFTTLEEVEAGVTALLTDDILPAEVETAQHIQALVSPFAKAASSIDSTLVKAVNAAAANVQQQIDGLRGKLRSAVKKQNTVWLDRVRSVWWTLYPNNTLQERVYPLLWHVARYGTEQVRIIVEQACNADRGNVAIVAILPEEQTGN